MTYFDAGRKVQVFNSLWYPRTEYHAPVLGIDLLCFAVRACMLSALKVPWDSHTTPHSLFQGVKVLTVVDSQPIIPRADGGCRGDWTGRFRGIRDRYPSLSGKMSARHYDEMQYFSDGMLFGRFDETNSITSDVKPAFQEYVREYVDMVAQMEPDPAQTHTVWEQQRAYDQYSADHDPAHALFVSYFGHEWANDFVHNFLFDLSTPPSDDDDKPALVSLPSVIRGAV